MLCWPVSAILTTPDPDCPRSWDFAIPNQISAASRVETRRRVNCNCQLRYLRAKTLFPFFFFFFFSPSCVAGR